MHLAEDASALTANNGMRAIRAAFNWAVKHGQMSQSPFKGVEFYKVAVSEKRPLSREEIERLVGASEGTCMEVGVPMLAFLGLRKGEASWAEWSDFDRENLYYRVRNKPPGFVLKDYEERVVPFRFSGLEEMLDHHWQEEGYCLLPEKRRARKGDFPYRYDFKKVFYKVRDRAGLSWVTPHTLRHTFVSQVASSGRVSLFELQKMLGHESIETTQRYAHLLPQDRPETIW